MSTNKFVAPETSKVHLFTFIQNFFYKIYKVVIPFSYSGQRQTTPNGYYTSRETHSPSQIDGDYKYGRFDASALHIAHALKQTEIQKAYNKRREKPIDYYLVSHYPYSTHVITVLYREIANWFCWQTKPLLNDRESNAYLLISAGKWSKRVTRMLMLHENQLKYIYGGVLYFIQAFKRWSWICNVWVRSHSHMDGYNVRPLFGYMSDDAIF